MAKTYNQLSSKRLSLIASNIANVDTPGFRSRDLDFSIKKLGVTHPSITQFSESGANIKKADLFTLSSKVTKEKNSVQLESEIFKSISAKRQFESSLAIYKSTLNLYRTALGR